MQRNEKPCYAKSNRLRPQIPLSILTKLNRLNMTLQEFFRFLGENPSYVLVFFTVIPLIALLTNFMGKGEGNMPPWTFLYATLIYLVCIPGIFAFALNIYQFLFDRRSIMETDILSQILPVCSMVATLLIIRQNVSFDSIPGFGKLSGLVLMIVATFAFMWFLDRTHIYVFSYLPFWQVVLIFIVLFLVIRWGWSQFITPKTNNE